ncbi:unnamed protein product [Blepharisma stoltei]|uniref:Endonuclease/exonuclease/phosphatase domain-containing protein n=1 Tax=Blepharisma stoltei TaxID=1481888 RepID=A0AAU9IP45_9CILI|nr:unnamed protein product [Blepharisma stoltei]
MLLGRTLTEVAPTPPLFTVMTWNTLSDQLSGFFPSVPDQFLSWGYRAPQIMHDLEESKADIYCLSEIDHYDDFIVPWINKIGFEGIFKKKRGWHRDGLCILFNRRKFTLISQESWYFPNSNQFALVIKLAFGAIEFLIVGTHLKSRSKYEEDRANQVRYLLSKLEKCAGRLPIILCGDFNSIPGSKTYNILNSHTKLKFQSAYMIFGSEPNFTTYKIRERVEKKTVDYIWIRGFSISRVLNIPSFESIGPTGLPSQEYPSDHLSLLCQLTIKPNESL